MHFIWIYLSVNVIVQKYWLRTLFLHLILETGLPFDVVIPATRRSGSLLGKGSIYKTCTPFPFCHFYYLYNIRRIRKYLSRLSTETLIHAFVSSRIDYCNSLLYGLPVYQLNKLQRVQNAAARLIFLESKYCHVRPLLYNLHWLPVKFRIDFKILLLTYKAINGLAPFYLQELISLKEACKYKLRSNCDGLLLNPLKFKTLTTLGDRSFTAAAPQLWNSLPYSIRSSPSVASFKKTLKTFISESLFVILCAF